MVFYHVLFGEIRGYYEPDQRSRSFSRLFSRELLFLSEILCFFHGFSAEHLNFSLSPREAAPRRPLAAGKGGLEWAKAKV